MASYQIWLSKYLTMKKFLKRMKKISADRNESSVLTVEDMRSAEVIVLQTEFKEAYKILNKKEVQKKKLEENIVCLNPYLDEKDLIMIERRLRGEEV